MTHKTKGTRVLIGLFAFVATAGIAATQESEINNSLSEIETFLATILDQFGIIVFLVGAAVWFVSRRNADRSQWGWRQMQTTKLTNSAALTLLPVSNQFHEVTCA